MQVEVKALRRPAGLNLRKMPAPENADHIRGVFEISVRNIGEISVDEVYTRFACEGFELITYSYNNIKHGFDIEFLPAVIDFGAVIHPSLRKSVRVALVSTTPQPLSDWKVQVYARDMIPRKATLPFVSKEDDSSIAECLP